MKKIAPLQPGAKIAVVAPCGPVEPARREAGLSALRAMGFAPKLFYDENASGHGYFSEPDDARLKWLQAAVDDHECAAIWPLRGGYGLSRIVDRIDFSALLQRPKLCIGLSDLTLFAQRLHTETGLPFFYGPMVAALGDGDGGDLDSLRHWLHTSHAPEFVPAENYRVLRGGTGAGKLVGGCLALLAAGLGGAADLDGKDYDCAILFIEDLNEPVFRLDRMLSSLRLAGRLSTLRGVICGHMLNIARPEKSLDLDAMLLEVFSGSDFPILTGFPCGHGPRTRTLPLYQRCAIAADGITFAAC